MSTPNEPAAPSAAKPDAGFLKRNWPSDHPPGPDAIECTCTGCGLEWRVHRDLLGYRLRCECGDWLAMPAHPVPPRPRREVIEAETPLALSPVESEPSEPELREIEPGPVETPRPAPARTVRSSESAGFFVTALELIVLAGATFAPAAVLVASPDLAPLRPFAGLFAAVGVLLVGVRTWPLLAASLASPKAGHVVEAVVVGALGFAVLRDPGLRDALGVDLGLLRTMRNDLGVGWSAFLFVLGPALFGELAFRGLLLGRLGETFGRAAGSLLCALAFGLAHGVTPVLPAAAAGGLYLAWLRWRSESVVPCVLAHGVVAASALGLAA